MLMPPSPKTITAATGAATLPYTSGWMDFSRGGGDGDDSSSIYVEDGLFCRLSWRTTIFSEIMLKTNFWQQKRQEWLKFPAWK